ncbi:hypothetical protein E3N88_15142 [Mikania micrantha]|uniref:PB1 domain-containing protein n=1 Tax=Mikania micrantha TaxID=192012 RepID=A0A5N6NV80_9ASTR|nr:hypothetical protein E3N88_15142 [Mikania micrantha]
MLRSDILRPFTRHRHYHGRCLNNHFCLPSFEHVEVSQDFFYVFEGAEVAKPHRMSPLLNAIHDKIKSAFLDIVCDPMTMSTLCIGQFWAPVTINDRRLLSTSGQPFVIPVLTKESAMYRLHSEKHQYDIDVNNLQIEGEGDPNIRSGGPAITFLRRLPNADHLPESESCFRLNFCIMLPICFPSDQSDCIGVLGLTFQYESYRMGWHLVPDVLKAIKKVGLDICKVQQHIPYEVRYNSFCDVFPLERTSKQHVLKTFQDFKLRYISVIRDDDLLLKWEDLDGSFCAFAICLRSLETRDFNYSFEFIWPNYSEDSRCDVFLEAILLTIKRCLPSFKFASGAEIGDDLEVVEVSCYKEGQNTSFKIFQGKQSIVADNIMEPSKVTCKTTSKVVPSKDMNNQWSDVICVTNPTQNPKVNKKTAKIFLTREVIEKQFGKTMNEAAHNLKGNDNLQLCLLIIVSLSTLKRNRKVLGILEWPGPNLRKRKANDSCTIQINTNEANVTTQDSLTVNINKDIVFIKAENEDDMIKFNLPVSQAKFLIVKKTIGEKFKLCDRTFKLKYLDEDGDWILLTSDVEMNDCIHSLRKSDRILVRLRVLPAQEPVSYPSG